MIVSMMRRKQSLIELAMVFMSCLLAAEVCAQPASGPPLDPKDAEFFETKIRPVLAENCFSCHGPRKQKAGLRLDSAAGRAAPVPLCHRPRAT